MKKKPIYVLSAVVIALVVTGSGLYCEASANGLALTSPNGGDVIPSGLPYTIQWVAPPEMVSFKLKYSMNNGTSWSTIESGITEASYGWAVPTPPKNKPKCLVKVIGYDALGKKLGADNSDAPFTIEVLTITSPNGGETLTSGSMHTIRWQTNGTKNPVEKVKLLYTKNGGKTWQTIETLTEDLGSYDWTVPGGPVAKPKGRCRVQVVLKDAKGNTVGKDTSDGDFTIAETFMSDYFPLSTCWETDDWTLIVRAKEREINGVLTTPMVNTREPIVFFWTNDEDGLRLHEVMDPDGIMGNVSVPIVFADAVPKVGDKRENTFTSVWGKFKLISKLIGVEDVSVPAGNFADCLKFKVTMYDITGGAENLDIKETWWLAKDVGFVKAVNDENADSSFFADPGQTCKLLSYYIAPSDPTPDHLALTDMGKQIAESFEAKDLDGLMSRYTDDFLHSCTDKAAMRSSYGTLFAENEGLWWFSSGGEEAVVSGDSAYNDRERVRSGVDNMTTKRWWDWDRQRVYFRKEGDEWKVCGNQANFRAYFYVWLRNDAVGGEYLVIGGSIYNCAGQIIDMDSEITSLTITGPPTTTTIIDPDLKQNWLPEYLEYFRDEDIGNAKNGFYTFTLETSDGKVIQSKDYLQVMPFLNIANLGSPIGGISIPGGDVTFDWTDVDRADYYAVDLQYYDAGTWRQWARINASQSGLTVNLPGGMNWRWRVRARQNDLYGELDNESRTDWAYFSTS